MAPATLTIANNGPTLFGFGEIKSVAKVLRDLLVARPLICTDQGLVASGLLNRLIAALPREMRTTIYDKTPSNPDELAVIAATRLYRDQDCDGVIAFGGGSSLDLGKAVALLATHDGKLSTYTTQRGGGARIGEVAPLVAIPTTAGTGSEVARASVLILGSGEKRIVASPNLIPKFAILDPELTFSLPSILTAATGMDAVTHCIEAVCSPIDNPCAEAIGLDGLARSIGSGALLQAVADGTDRAARADMMKASTQGAMAFSKGLGAVHAMSHACGKNQSLTLHHGTLNAVLLPPVLRYNRDGAGAKYQRISAAMALPAGKDLASAIEDLNSRLGLPASLAQMGITSAMIPDLARHAEADMCSATNPVPMDRERYATLFEMALQP